jgi:hypothetical protein
MAQATMKAMKIMQKPYHLVHDGIKEGEAVTVTPPRLPGLNKDFVNPKNDKGEWIRVFTVSEGNTGMRKGKELTLTHAPGEVPSCEIDGVKWYIQPIPGIAAVKKRGPERKGYKGTMVADSAAPAGEQPVKRGRGRPKGSKNKPKAGVAAQPPADAPKRRGRPPGSKNKPVGDLNQELMARIRALEALIRGGGQAKRRGRPPGSKNKEKSASGTNGNGRRGRPPGSKNKSTLTYEKRLKALEKARAARKAKLKAAKAETAAAPAAAAEPEVIKNA